MIFFRGIETTNQTDKWLSSDNQTWPWFPMNIFVGRFLSQLAMFDHGHRWTRPRMILHNKNSRNPSPILQKASDSAVNPGGSMLKHAQIPHPFVNLLSSSPKFLPLFQNLLRSQAPSAVQKSKTYASMQPFRNRNLLYLTTFHTDNSMSESI